MLKLIYYSRGPKGLQNPLLVKFTFCELDPYIFADKKIEV